MANARKKISELTALTSASLNTVIVGVDNGTTYKIELDVLADAVTSRVNILDRDRLQYLESVTSSFETKGRHIVSGSSQLTSSYDGRYVLSGSITQTTWDNIANKPNGIVSQSTDLTSLNNFTASISTASLVNRLNAIESISGSWITESETGSFLTNLNGAISGAGQIADLGFVTGAYAYLNEFNSLTQSFNIISGSVVNITNAVDVTQLNNTTASLNSFTQSANTRLTNLEAHTSSYLTSLSGAISSSSQLSGTTIQNLSGSFTGSFRGNIAGTATYSDTTKLLNSNTNQDYSIVFTTSGSNGYLTQYTDGLSNFLYNPSTNRLKVDYIQGAIEANNGVISGSSQLTSSYDSRYVLSGSISAVPAGTISGSAQITSLGFVSGSYLTSLSGAISSSSQLTSSYDNRYLTIDSDNVISSSAQITALGFISSSTSVNTSSLATTGSNTFIGTETISGSLLLSGSFSYNGTPLQSGFAFAQPVLSKIVSNASYTGAASWTGTYVSTGGAIIVRADVTGYRASVGTGTAVLYRDSVAVASHSFFFNQANVHTTIPTITYVRNSETGSHTYSIGFTDIVADVNDYLNITVLEYGNSAMFPSTIISGSSQLTSSYDSRYVLSGSVGATPTGTISGSAQITSFGFVSGSYETTGRGIISSSANLVTTSSFNSYTASISTASLVTSITNLNTFTASVSTASLVTSITNLNSFSASENTKASTLASYTASVNITTSSLNAFTSSINSWTSSFSSSLTSSITSVSGTFSDLTLNGSRINANGLITTDYIQSGRITSDQTSVGAGSDIIFNTTIKNSGISMNTSTGVFTLTANKTYRLFAEISWANFSDASGGYIIYEWVDATTNTALDSTGTAVGVGEAINRNTNEFNATSATLIYTPTTNQTIKVRIAGASGTATVRQGIGTKAIVEQINSSFALNTISGGINYTQVLGNQRNGINTGGTSIVSGSITTTGKPVQITVSGDANPTSGTGQWCSLQIYRDGSAIGNGIQLEAANQNENQGYSLNLIDTPAAGTYTYSLRVPTITGTFQFGEVAGPVLIIKELGSLAIITDTNNTFTGANTFSGSTTIKGALNVNNGVGSGGSNEGGEIDLQYAASTTLTGSFVALDVYGDKVRIFEGGGNNRGVSIDLSKAPASVGGELMWKASGIVNAGTFVTLDNIKATVTTSNSRGLSVATIAGTVSGYISGHYQLVVGGPSGGASTTSLSTTATSSMFNWNFGSEGDTATFILRDNTNNRVYRIIMIIGPSYNNNFISIERLY